MAFVEINNLTKILNKNCILKDINLNLEKGKIYGFLGRNGSGKTMFFRILCGLVSPTNGNVKIDNKVLGKDIAFPTSCGVVIESPGFWDHYTGFENLKVLSRIKNIISEDDIISYMTAVGLDYTDKRTFRKYSLGMKQKLAIAQALMEKPDLIILDEPSNGLDEESISEIRDLIKKEKERGALILIASHNREDIDYLCDYKFKISNGNILDFQ